jgi:hypothetical protein
MVRLYILIQIVLFLIQSGTTQTTSLSIDGTEVSVKSDNVPLVGTVDSSFVLQH